MRDGKSVLIENSVDSAVFKHGMEHVTPLTDYKIIRQNDKDVLILDWRGAYQKMYFKRINVVMEYMLM